MVRAKTQWPNPMTDDEKDFFVKLGARLADLRREQGLTQAQVADRLGVSQQTVNSFEKGRRRIPVSALPELAKLLGVSIEEFIDGRQGNHAGRRGPPSRLHRQLEEIERLPRAKQRFIVEMLDAVIAQAQRRQAS